MKTITEAISKLSSNRRLADFLFILWAGGAALLSYSLVYTLRKPFTAATFDGIEAFGFDYKVLVTIIQIAGYLSQVYRYQVDFRIEERESPEVYTRFHCRSGIVIGCVRSTSHSL